MSKDASEINQMLSSRMEEVCMYLLPKGKRKGNCWHVGNIQGDEGDSLHITMHGSAAGRFSDFSDKDVKGGTPLWLWSKVRNINFRDAIKEAADWLGVQAEDFGIKKHHKQHYLAPNPNEGRVAEPNTPVMDYLTLERKLDPIVVASAKVGETDDGGSIIFNFADWNEEKSQWMLAHRKFLKLQRDSDGKKQTYSSKGTKRCLYGKNLIKDDVSEIVISEGEIDALSWQSYGIPAVSIPNGVQDDTWIDLDWEWLSRFEKIYLSMDMDEPGQQAAQDFCKRLGLHRCQIVSLPKKDCNDCLVGGVPREEMQKAIETSKPIELDEIKKPDSFKNEVLSYYDEDPSQQGWDTPWSPELPWKVRRGELTILSGFGGHGKALALDTPIPTPAGWTTMGELFPGDQVFDENGNTCNVVFATPVQLNRECFRVTFSDGATIVADSDHLWEVWPSNARTSRSRQLHGDKRKRATNRKNPQKHKLVGPVTLTTREIMSFDDWSKLAVAVAGPLQLSEAKLEIDPYTLGAWLGDGNSDYEMITNHPLDSQILKEIEKAGYQVIERQTTFNKALGKWRTPRFRIVGLQDALRNLNLLKNKHIPVKFLRASMAQRISLLQGLMDTDGTISTSGTCEFSSSNIEIATGLRELLASLGIRSSIRTGKSSLYGKECALRHRIQFTTHLPVFRLERKLNRIDTNPLRLNRAYRYIESITPVESVPVKCIQVDSPSHLYLCGREMIPTHNTQGLNQLMIKLLSQDLRVMDASFEIRPGLTLYYMTRCALGQKFSTKEEATACMEWLNHGMFFLDCIGVMNVDRLFHAMEYARKRHGIDVFVIDSLFKLGLSSEDYGGQRELMDRLTTFCNNTGAHVILVAHSRKTQNGNEYSVPSKADIAGSADIGNAAFNVIIFWRHKMKKRKLDEAKQNDNYEEIAKWQDQHDGQIVIDKQRFGEGEECSVMTWFNRESCQFHLTNGRNIKYFELK